ncbi:MATE family efflux transporter [Sedimentibacter sp. zth1]|nr:MATE family efflux transporter [Sedimentibacter sp. zth1]QSX07074.1 MATE family efflux transporter [Sedimentibacter sp. zth1]
MLTRKQKSIILYLKKQYIIVRRIYMECTKQKGLMTEGSIFKKLLYFSTPLLIGNIFQQLYNTVDSIVVGNFIGDNALAAVNSSGAVINLLVSFFMGLSMGGGVVISNYFGAEDELGVHKAVHTTFALTIVSGIIVTIIGVLLTPIILKWVNVDPEVMPDSILYLKIFFAGILGLIIYNICTGMLRAVGDSKHPLYFLIISSVLNIVLDLLFVAVFNFGIAGVAYATIIAQFISAILTIRLLIKTDQTYKLDLKKIKFYKEILIKILKIGFPSAIQNAVVSFSNVVVQANINSFGKVAMAGAGCYTKVAGFALMPVMSFSMALTTFVGQNIGAKKYERVKKGAKIGLIMSCSTILFVSVLLIIFGPQIMSIFTDNQDFIAIGELMMNTVVPGYLLLAISHTIAGVMRGAGLTKVPMYVMVSCWCVCRVIWITVTAKIFNNIRFVFMGWPVTWVLSAIILIIYYKKVNWLYKNN